MISHDTGSERKKGAIPPLAPLAMPSLLQLLVLTLVFGVSQGEYHAENDLKARLTKQLGVTPRRGNAVVTSPTGAQLLVTSSDGKLAIVDTANMEGEPMMYDASQAQSEVVVSCEGGVAIDQVQQYAVFSVIDNFENAPVSRIIAVNLSDASLRWEVSLPGRAAGTPVVGSNGIYVVHNEDDLGKVSVIQPSEMSAEVVATLPETSEGSFAPPTGTVISVPDGVDIDVVAFGSTETAITGSFYYLMPSADHTALQGQGETAYSLITISDRVAAVFHRPVISADAGQAYLGAARASLGGWNDASELTDVLAGTATEASPNWVMQRGRSNEDRDLPLPNPPALSDDTQYICAGGPRPEVFCVEATGDLAWANNGVGGDHYAPAVFHGTKVYFVEAESGMVRQFDVEDGNENWEWSCADSPDCDASSPMEAEFAISASGNVLYMVDTSGSLVVMEVASFETPAPTSAPTESPSLAPVVSVTATAEPATAPVEPTEAPAISIFKPGDDASKASSSSGGLSDDLTIILGAAAGGLLLLVLLVLFFICRRRRGAKSASNRDTETREKSMEEGRRHEDETSSTIPATPEKRKRKKFGSPSKGSPKGTPSTLDSIDESSVELTDTDNGVGYEMSLEPKIAIPSKSSDPPARNLASSFSSAVGREKSIKSILRTTSPMVLVSDGESTARETDTMSIASKETVSVKNSHASLPRVTQSEEDVEKVAVSARSAVDELLAVDMSPSRDEDDKGNGLDDGESSAISGLLSSFTGEPGKIHMGPTRPDSPSGLVSVDESLYLDNSTIASGVMSLGDKSMTTKSTLGPADEPGKLKPGEKQTPVPVAMPTDVRENWRFGKSDARDREFSDSRRPAFHGESLRRAGRQAEDLSDGKIRGSSFRTGLEARRSARKPPATATPEKKPDAWSSFMTELSKAEKAFFQPSLTSTGNDDSKKPSVQL